MGKYEERKGNKEMIRSTTEGKMVRFAASLGAAAPPRAGCACTEVVRGYAAHQRESLPLRWGRLRRLEKLSYARYSAGNRVTTGRDARLAPLPAARDRTAGKSSGCVDGLLLLWNWCCGFLSVAGQVLFVSS